MTAADHLRKHPNARPSTIAWMILRDAKTEELRSELPRKRAGIFARLIGFVRKAVLDDLRRV
ncbi:hypothetical protein [Shinella zoogloeoides]|uniref:hypothetical protein n=1 Tax=Shinella zoogloeoides TaxID=352475 RepID=UPI0028AEC756|nr:hypothetical protein [Shinella zoogloeoides]